MLVPPGGGGSPPVPPPPPPSPPPAFAVAGQPLLFTPPDSGQGSIQGVIITNMSPYPIEVYNGEQIDKWLPPGVMDYVPLGYNGSQVKVIPYSLTTRSIATIEAQSLLLAWVQAGDPLPENLPIVVQQTTTTVPVAPVAVLNSGFTNTSLGAGLTLAAAPGGGQQLVLYQAEIVPSADSDSPYIATSDYLSSPAPSKVFAASEKGRYSRRSWNVSGSGLILPAGIGIVAYPNPAPTLVSTDTFYGNILTGGGGGGSGFSVTLAETPSNGNLITIALGMYGSLLDGVQPLISGNAVGAGSWSPVGGSGGNFTSDGQTNPEVGGTKGGVWMFYGFVGAGASTTISLIDGDSAANTNTWTTYIIVRQWANVPQVLDATAGADGSLDTGNFHCYINGLAYAAAINTGDSMSYPGGSWTNGNILHLDFIDAYQFPALTGNVDAAFSSTDTLFYAVAGQSFGELASGEFASGGITYGIMA